MNLDEAVWIALAVAAVTAFCTAFCTYLADRHVEHVKRRRREKQAIKAILHEMELNLQAVEHLLNYCLDILNESDAEEIILSIPNEYRVRNDFLNSFCANLWVDQDDVARHLVYLARNIDISAELVSGALEQFSSQKSQDGKAMERFSENCVDAIAPILNCFDQTMDKCFEYPIVADKLRPVGMRLMDLKPKLEILDANPSKALS